MVNENSYKSLWVINKELLDSIRDTKEEINYHDYN